MILTLMRYLDVAPKEILQHLIVELFMYNGYEKLEQTIHDKT